jgi:hypothetical protein
MLDRRALWFELSLFLFLTACQLEVRRDSGNDDAAHQDAGSEDAGSEDAGSEDAGSEDAGSEDAGSEDAGIGFDCEIHFIGSPMHVYERLHPLVRGLL